MGESHPHPLLPLEQIFHALQAFRIFTFVTGKGNPWQKSFMCISQYELKLIQLCRILKNRGHTPDPCCFKVRGWGPKKREGWNEGKERREGRGIRMGHVHPLLRQRFQWLVLLCKLFTTVASWIFIIRYEYSNISDARFHFSSRFLEGCQAEWARVAYRINTGMVDPPKVVTNLSANRARCIA